MEIDYDVAKRDQVLAERGLDLARAGEAFADFHLTRRDDKHSDVEDRFHSIGMIDLDIVIIPWTPRGNLRRIVTMWKANDRERQKYHEARNRPG
ncbi:MAG: BrnT family toxin [Novosphingobium sp.]